jgi:multiple sugar transport system ATP-binding protein
MASISLERVGKSFGRTAVLHELSLEVAEGEFVVLLGPSGCGKSTLLRMIAGLEDPTSGRILFSGKDVTYASPRDRDVAMVFQSYALYPHMDVAENMGLALKLKGVPRAERDARVTAAAEMLGLTTLLARKPRELSGGQRQRVAMGRAIVRDPVAFLFDEPLSNLDAELRLKMRTEIKKLHQRLRRTTLYVTHDQMEALTLADRVVVLRGGDVQQVGTPLEVFRRPRNLFVAGFLGSPAMNLLRARVASIEGPTARLDIEGFGAEACLPLSGWNVRAGQEVVVGLRPEELVVTGGGFGAGEPNAEPFALRCGAHVSLVEPLGTEMLVTLDSPRMATSAGRVVDSAQDSLVHRCVLREDVRVGDVVEVALPASRVHVFDAASESTTRL